MLEMIQLAWSKSTVDGDRQVENGKWGSDTSSELYDIYGVLLACMACDVCELSQTAMESFDRCRLLVTSRGTDKRWKNRTMKPQQKLTTANQSLLCAIGQ